MDYTQNPNSVIFLKDTDIVQDVEGKNSSGEKVLANGVASYDFANSISSTAKTQINTVEQTVAALDSWTKEEFQNTSSYISNDVSVSLNNAITAVDDKVGKLSENTAISVEGLCTAIDTKTNYLSGIISDDISTSIDAANAAFTEFKLCTETSAANLTTAIDGIKADVKGGVNYKGHLKLNVFSDPQDLSTYVSFLHGGSYQGDTITIPDDVAAAELNNGWMYYVSLTGDDISSYTTKDGITFVPGNYIIVHAHNVEGDASGLSSVTLSNLNRGNIDIVQVTDSDLVRFKDLNAALTGDIEGELGGISAAVKSEFKTTSAWVTGIVHTVSTSLSTDYSEKFNLADSERSRLCTALSDALTAETAAREAYSTAADTKINEISTTTIPEIKAALQEEADARATEDAVINEKVDAKVIVKEYSSIGEVTTFPVEQLKINRMTAAQYAQLAADDKVSENELYSITDVELNSYGKKILSVGDPENPLDAANKSYVDTAADRANIKADNISSSAKAEFNQTSTYINSISTALSDKVKADYALSADGKFAQISVQNLATFNSVTAGSLTATNEVAENLTATNINATKLHVYDSNVVLSTGDTAINVTTKRGLQDFLVNGTSLQDSLTASSSNTLTEAKSYSNQLSASVSTTASERIATALTDAKSYTDELSTAIDSKLTATSSYIDVQDAAASANAYNQVKADLTSQLDSNNHLKLFIGDKAFADYKMHNVLQSASLSTIDGQKAIVFTWNTQQGVENTTSVLVQDLIDTYNGDGTYIKLSSDSTTFYLDFNALSNALGVGQLSTRASNIETSCAGFDGRLTALEADNATNKDNIRTLSNSLTAADTGINATLTSHGNSIRSLQNDVASINSTINDIRSGSTNSIQSLTNEISAVIEPNLKDLNEAKAQLCTNVGTVNTTINEHGTKLGTIEQRIATIDSTLEVAGRSIDQAAASIETIKINIQAADDKIEQISTNYAPKSLLTDYASANSVYRKTETSSSIEIQNAFTGLTNTYYPVATADSIFAKRDEIAVNHYSKTEIDNKFVTQTAAGSTYETAANVDNLINSIKNQLVSVNTVDKINESTTELSTAVNTLIDSFNSVLSVLKTIAKN